MESCFVCLYGDGKISGELVSWFPVQVVAPQSIQTVPKAVWDCLALEGSNR